MLPPIRTLAPTPHIAKAKGIRHTREKPSPLNGGWVGNRLLALLEGLSYAVRLCKKYTTP